MFNRWIHPQAHFYLNLVGMMLIAIGLPLNKVVLSIGTIWIISNWLLEFDFKSKWQRLKENKIVWIALGFYFLHFIGLLWTENFEYALKDLNTKLPFVVVPFVIGTRTAIPKQHIKIILISFLFSLLVTSLFNFGFYYFSDGYKDYRTMSLFGSHIRYGILIAIGLVIALGFLVKASKVSRVYWSLPIIWLVFYIMYSQVGTSIILLVLLILSSIVYSILKIKSRTVKVLMFLVPLSILGYVAYEVNFVYQDTLPKELTKEPKAEATINGNLYTFGTGEDYFERGYVVFDYVCELELYKEWNKVSRVGYEDTLVNGYPANQVLIRYMTSKGLKKDSMDFQQLNQSDIQNIENGISSIVKLDNPLRKKLYEIESEIRFAKSGLDPNGHSILQRLEHWNIGLELAKENWIYGVGTGDVPNAFSEYYKNNDSDLAKENQHRTHSQILTVLITFGVFGLLFIVAFLFFPIKRINSINTFLFYIILLFIFLTSDVLETQVGVSLVAFFYSIFYINSAESKLD